jgi:hypothetical protein
VRTWILTAITAVFALTLAVQVVQAADAVKAVQAANSASLKRIGPKNLGDLCGAYGRCCATSAGKEYCCDWFNTHCKQK